VLLSVGVFGKLQRLLILLTIKDNELKTYSTPIAAKTMLYGVLWPEFLSEYLLVPFN